MKYLLFSCFLVLQLFAEAQQPARKAVIGAIGRYGKSGMTVDSVVHASTVYAAGVRKGDVITAINDKPITDAQSYSTIAGAIRTGDDVTFVFIRDGTTKSKKVKAVMRAYETSELAEVYYDWVPYKQCKLRAVTRKPKNIASAPAVLLIPGYNCGSVENFSGSIYKNLINGWLRDGYVVVTIEKSGLGDSYGCTPCAQVDLVTDIQTFDAGYNYMEALPYVDKSNLFIWGHSMGGVIAPEVARLHNPKGVIAFATVFRPWAEFLPEMHRVQFPLDGHSYQKTEQDVRVIHKMYDAFFTEKKTVEQLHNIPEFKDLAVREFGYAPGNEDLWGRHYRYWQQIDSLDMAAAWSAVKCPVFSVFGAADFVACSELEHQLITRTVNAAHPGNCTHITIPDVDHLILQNNTWKEAYEAFNNRSAWAAKAHPGFSAIINKWMNEQVKRK